MMRKKEGFIMPDYDPNDVLLFYETVGHSLHMIQLFEQTITHYIITVHKSNSELTSTEIDGLYNKFEKFWLRKLFLEVKQCEKLPEELETRIEKFITERNWLVHYSYKKNHTAVYNKTEFDALINRIVQLADEALSLSKMFQMNSDEYLIKKGFVTREQLDERTQEILNAWGNKSNNGSEL